MGKRIQIGEPSPVRDRVVDVQDIVVQKQQSGQRLILRTGGDASLDGKVGQKRFRFWRGHRIRMTNAMKTDIAFDSVEVGTLGA